MIARKHQIQFFAPEMMTPEQYFLIKLMKMINIFSSEFFSDQVDTLKRIRSKIENNSSNKKLKAHTKHLCHELSHSVCEVDVLQLNNNTG